MLLLSLLMAPLSASAEEPCKLTPEQVYPVLTQLVFVVFDLDRNDKITREEIAVISPELAQGPVGDYVAGYKNGIGRHYVNVYIKVLNPLKMVDTNKDGLIQYEEVGEDVPREIFDILDHNHNDVIDCEDFDFLTEPYSQGDGEECGTEEIMAIVARGGVLYLDQNNDEMLTREEIMTGISEAGDLGSDEEVFTAVFNMLDVDKDELVSAVELHATLLSIPINLMNLIDQNQDNAIQFTEVPFVPPLLFLQLDTVVNGQLDCADYKAQVATEEIELPKGVIGGVVRDAATNLPLSEAVVTLTPGGFSDTSLALVGTFGFSDIPYGRYTLQVVLEGYEPLTQIIRINLPITTLDLLLQPEAVEEGEVEGESPALVTLAGVVRDQDTGFPISGALVTLTPGDFQEVSLDILGTFMFNEIPAGNYRLAVTKEGYQTYSTDLFLESGFGDVIDVPLTAENTIEGEEQPVEGEEQPVEGEVAPAEGETGDVEGEESPEEGEVQPAEGETVPDNGEKGVITGIIRNNATWLPVGKAVVRLTPGGYETTSDDISGTYLFSSIPLGKYTIHVAHPAFQSYAEAVELKRGLFGVANLLALDIVLTMTEAEGEVQPAEGEVQPAEGEVQPAEGEVQPVEGEVQPVEGEVQPVEGEVQPAEGEVQPVEGEVQPVEGEDVAQEGEAEDEEDDGAGISGCFSSSKASPKAFLADWLLLALSFMSVGVLRSLKEK
jgi:Ca2+-binding EF-hand superfamily protein